MNFVRMLTFVLAGALWVSAFEYRPLSKKETRQFKEAYVAVSTAFSDGNFIAVTRFGPDLLQKYVSVLIQKEKRALALRPKYQRLDSITSYSLYRVKIDSLFKWTMKNKSGSTNKRDLLYVLDGIWKTLRDVEVLLRYDAEWHDDMLLKTEVQLEVLIPKFMREMEVRGDLEGAASFLKTLEYRTNFPKSYSRGDGKSLEEAYSRAMASNRVDRLLAFQKKHPEFKKNEIQGRINVLEGDWVRLVLSGRNKDEMIQFIQNARNPVYQKQVEERLEAVLYHEALSAGSPEACKLYLSFFPGSTRRGARVSGILESLMYPPDGRDVVPGRDYFLGEVQVNPLKGSPEQREVEKTGNENPAPEKTNNKMLELGQIKP